MKHTHTKPLIVFGALLALSLILSITASAEQEPLPVLFSAPVEGEIRTGGHDGPEVIRSRAAAVDVELLESAARSARPGTMAFELNFFEGAIYQAAIQQVVEMGGGSVGLVGVVDSPEYNELVMVLRGDALQAYLQVGSKTFEVRFEGEGHLIVEVDQSGYPDALPPAVKDDPAADGRSTSREAAAADTGDRVDVLVVYTPAARDLVGGVTAVETRIQQSILSSNAGYAASGINFELRLVGMELVNYDEIVPGKTDAEMWQYALRRLTYGYYPGQEPTANYLADARAYREQYGADLVFMMTDLPYIYCGLGWLGGDPSDDDIGFSVVHGYCTGSTSLTPQHEMGHNMGACHDRDNTSVPFEYCYYDYSFGYQNPNNFYTVMAYYSGCGSCSRINRWSNPDIPYGGEETGIPIGNPLAAHNALSLNNRAFTIANYRPEAEPISGSFVTPLAGEQALMPRTNLEVTASSNAGSVTSVRFEAYYDGSWQALTTDADGGDGWAYVWNTIDLNEQVIGVRAVIEDSVGNDRTIEISSVTLSPTIESDSNSETRGGRPSVEVAEETVLSPETELETATLEQETAAPAQAVEVEAEAVAVVPMTSSKWMVDEPRRLPAD